MVSASFVDNAMTRLEQVGGEFTRTLGIQFRLPYKKEAALLDAAKLMLTMLKPYAYLARNDASLIAGRPDLEVVICGMYVGLELKRNKGKRSAAQIDTAEAIIRAGGECNQFKTLFEIYDALHKTLENLKIGLHFV